MPRFDANDPLKYPLRLTDDLPFLDTDIREFPWLASGDRYYKLDKELGRGGYSKAYTGYPCDADGKKISDIRIVVKMPRLSSIHLGAEITFRNSYITERNLDEWTLIRYKLLGCEHANLIFDMGILIHEKNSLSVTVQPFLRDAQSLDDWLISSKQKGRSTVDPKTGRQNHGWGGIRDWKLWLHLATLISVGLEKIHRCRVIHGDVWPPNIFIDKNSAKAIFIDFGEAFGAIPSGDARNQIDHAYRAPERGNKEYVPMEQVDVYSFGKLLLYLTIGKDELIPPAKDGEPLWGRARRIWVRDKLFDPTGGSPAIVSEHPEVLDIIAQCTQWDPVDRPSMVEVSNELRRLEASPAPRLGKELVPRLQKLTADIDDSIGSPFARMIDSEVSALQELVESCRSEMVEVRGTRDKLVSALVSLFDEIGKRDSWTTITTPSVWQESALGLDGRYATATIEAVRRGAAVHRTYAVSIEELGSDWARIFADELKKSGDDALTGWAASFGDLIRECEYLTGANNYKSRSPKFLESHQGRFVSLIEALHDMVTHWELKDQIAARQFTSIKDTRKLFLGLLPVSTLSKIREMRTENPVSLLYLDREPKEHDKWLMVMTDIRGRNEYNYDDAGWPQLRGIRVYKSAREIPRDRIISMERLMTKKENLNIGPLLGLLVACVHNTRKRFSAKAPSATT
ncbi:MAG TPA: protein kinase [Bryobacteraceae bacterium]|jgi:serine/threonine protein kinase